MKKFVVGSIGTFLFLCSIGLGQNEKGKVGKKSPSVGTIDIKELFPGIVQGKVASSPNEKSLAIQVPVPGRGGNPDGDKNSKQGQNKGNKKGKQDISKALMEKMKTQMETQWKDLEVPVTPKTKYRYFEPPQSFDEKGNIIKWNKEELKKIKGDPNLPGFEAKPENILPGHLVDIKLENVKMEDGKTRLAATLVYDRGALVSTGVPPNKKKN